MPPAPESRDKLPADPLVFVSDTSTEAERLIACLRARGFRVRDVPLLLLAGRVESQKPGLIVCDGEAPKLVEALKRIREGEWGKQVGVLLLGGDTEELTTSLNGLIDSVPEHQFARPIDVYSILQTIEETIGSPVNRPALAGGVSMASLPRLQPPPSVPHHDSAHPHLSSPMPMPRSSGPAASFRVPPLRMGGSEPSVVPRQGTSHPAPIEESGPLQPTPQFPVTRVSRELESLLETAEQKLGNSASALQAPAQEHMSPEAELNAILPPDVLAALDEPLEIDDADDASSPGTSPGERGRLRSNAPSGAPLDKDTGRIASRPGGTFAAAGTGSLSPAHGTLAGATPVPASRGSFIPVPSFAPATSPNIAFGESLPPATVPQPVVKFDSIPEPDTDAPAATLPPQRLRTEAEAAADVVTPRPSMEPDDLISTAPPVAPPPARLPPPLSREPADYEQSRPARSQRDRVVSDRADRNAARPPPVDRRMTVPTPEPALSIPSAIGRGDVLRALAELIRNRYSGSFAVEDDQGVRRVVLRDGDFVVVASGIDSESLVAFLIQRGDLSADASRLERKLPHFGRHAGAALIAHGHLRQDELWPVLRAHAEWLLGRTLAVENGSVALETELPPRLQGEPAVFGGATGAEVLIETVRRVLAPEQALMALGGQRGRLAPGPSRQLLNECALEPQETAIIEQCAGKTVQEVLSQAGTNDFVPALQALVALGVLSVLAPSANDKTEDKPEPRDAFDDAAIRSRIELRRGLVDEGDYYAFLGIDRDATGYQIRHAYLDLRREFEPSRLLTAATADLRDDVDVILEVLDEAYEVLRDPTRRERYRRALAADPR